MQSLIKIQYLYIEANELIELKKYYAASQKLEEATDLFKSFSSLTEEEEHLKKKIEKILVALDDYLNPDPFPGPMLGPDTSPVTLDIDDLIRDGVEDEMQEFSFEEDVIEFGVWRSFWMCLEPVKKLMNNLTISFSGAKFKID